MEPLEGHSDDAGIIAKQEVIENATSNGGLTDNPDVADLGEHAIDQLDEESGLPSDCHNGDPTGDAGVSVLDGMDIARDQDVPGSPTTGAEPPGVNSWSNVKCVFCEASLSLNDQPKLMECLHASCTPCVSSKLNEPNQDTADVVVEVNSISCPACTVVSSITNIIDNQFLLELCMENDVGAHPDLNKSLSDLKCSSCQDSAPATSWCVDCAEFICDDCVQAHQRLKITKEHTIKPKEEGDLENHTAASTITSKNFFCNIHPQEHLTLFCETCDRLTCRDCQLTEHRDHKYKFSHEIASESRGMITNLLSEVSYKRVLLKSATKVIEDRQVLIVEKKKALLQEITQMVYRLTNAINQRGKQLVVRLNEVCDSKQKTLSEKKMALEQLSLVTDHCIDFVTNAVNKGSDMALLFSKRQITQHLQRIKSRRADIPNPEIPVRIHLATDKVPDLIRVLSSIGNIVVDGRVYPSQHNNTNNQSGSNSTGSGASGASVTATVSAAPNQPLHQAPLHAQAASQNAYSSVQQYFPPGSSLRQSTSMGPAGPQRAATPPQPQHLQNLQALPAQVARNLNMLRHSPQHPQGLGLMRTHHQQVTSSTHPIADGRNVTLQAMLNPRAAPQPGGPTPPLVPPPAQGRGPLPVGHPVQHTSAMSHSVQRRYQDPLAAQQAAAQHHYQREYMRHHHQQQQQQHQHQQQQQQQQQQHHNMQQYGTYHPGQAPGGSATWAGQAAQAQVAQRGVTQSVPGQHPQSQGMHQWHIPQHGVPQHGNLGRSGHALNHQDNNSYKITLKTQVSPLLPQPPASSPGAHAVSINAGPVPGAIPIKQASASHSVGREESRTPRPNDRTSSNSSNSSSSCNNSNGERSISRQSSTSYMVSSSAPKTPSPSLNKPEDAERSLDKYCEESVNDLMATIAKLDSNGIVVIPEPQPTAQAQSAQAGDSPQVDSSTGDSRHQVTDKQEEAEPAKDDPNEDWCAVCMDGGELVCCDKCPKVFHMHCHIPTLEALPEDTWQCLLCTDINEVASHIVDADDKSQSALSQYELKLARRLVLELYCQYEPSLPFRDNVGPEVATYHEQINNPMSLETVRSKLSPENPQHYCNLAEVIKDIRLIFKNAYAFNSSDSQVYGDAKTLEEFLEHLLLKWLPNFTFPKENGDSEEEAGARELEQGNDNGEVMPPAKRLKRGVVD